MSPLRQRMDDAMVLRGFAERTREAYLLCVRSLAKYYRRPPARSTRRRRVAGLRVSEVCALQLADIESAPDRMCIKVRQGKGGKDCYTILSPQLLTALREYWRACRPRYWLFPGACGEALATSTPTH